ncbi:T9SS C-terminal target domain-containing protein [Marinilabiliaceae bacterium JC017]|nr:T9SS C-terminal target domain-containing protein [Marinilabiliaceae bacterium JC017]
MKKILPVILLLCSCLLSAQDYLGLEGSVPAGWTASGSSLSISGNHYKMGSQSVKWDWSPGSRITIANPSGLAQACTTYKGGMILWIYNETAKEDDLTFEYLDSNNTVQYYFTYHLNFTGWRACWIRFDEDMKGVKNDKNLTSVKIKAPSTTTGGTLYFDRMKFPSKRINDRVTPDAQLPYINPTMNANHWAALWSWHNTYQYDIALPSTVSTDEKAAFTEIRNRITNDIAGSAPSTSRITALKTQFNALNIQRNGDRITGNAFVPADEYVSANNDKRLKDLDALVYNMAKAWYHNNEPGFDQMFIDILDWLYDQGLTIGSGMGTNHHYGYSFRCFPKAIWLMQDALKSAGKFQQAFDMIQYWTGVPEIRQLPETANFQGIVDAWNTIIPGRLTAIMLRDDSPELVRDLQSFTRWMNTMLQPSIGTMGGLKPDGAGFHHGMLYAGYMNGGYAGLGTILNYVGNTHYNLSQESRANFKDALMVHALYANKLSLVNSVCGRNPMNQNLGSAAINAFAYLAKASDPVDREAAAQYMRLSSSNKDLYKEFAALGIQPAEAPSLNRSINYGALNIHRRDNWLVATKGFNQIVTGTEIYTTSNRYGRYQGYGTVQVLASGNPVSATESGYVMEGWDWNRFPGATTIHLPYDLLDYSGSNLNDRSKNEAFAGACSLNDNGVFGMKLDENGYTNYTDDFVARKSVFAFDNRIVCLGSGITNSNSQYATETTLFQAHLDNTSEVIVINDEQLNSFPVKRSITTAKPTMIMDTKGNGYYIPSGTINIQKDNQESRHNKNKSVNNGDFASAWLYHGKAPSDAGYEYAMLVQTSVNDLNTFKSQMDDAATAPYKVIRKDATAHIVSDKATQTTGYVLFEAADDISDQHIKSTSYPCLVMVKDLADNALQLSMADPAINMKKPTTLVHDAVAKERKIQITLNGRYALNGASDKCKIVGWEANATILEFTCIHGLPVNIELIPEVPLLNSLQIDGASPANWNPAVTQAQITIPQGHIPAFEAIAANEADEVTIQQPASFPGQVEITVTNAKGSQTVYALEVQIAASYIEDLEKFTEEGWVNTSFMGNNNIEWFVNGKKDSHLGTGTSVYAFNATQCLRSQTIQGGISTLSFEAKDIWAPDEERSIEVRINDQLVKTEKHTGTKKYTVSLADLTITGDISIAITNASSTKCAVAIDNIQWSGYAPDRNAYLKSISVKGSPLEEFTAEMETYDVFLDSTENMPVIEATCLSEKATFEITMPTQLPGTASIMVHAEDGSWKTYQLKMDFAKGIHNNTYHNIAVIYPNPVKEQLFIRSEKEIYRIEVYSTGGKLVYSKQGHPSAIPTQQMNNGLFIMHVTFVDNQKEVLKFIKQ